jgi:hypothetical protein
MCSLPVNQGSVLVQRSASQVELLDYSIQRVSDMPLTAALSIVIATLQRPRSVFSLSPPQPA